MVSGNPLYGIEPVIQDVKIDQCEPLIVQGSKKRVCVKDMTSNAAKARQTLSDIVHQLQSTYPALPDIVH
jgi:hypothetical protein